MRREIQLTSDGSHTIYLPEMDEHYHSVNGALREAIHIYIDAGFRSIEKHHIRILEIGFGTGLNALLTLKEAESSCVTVDYYSVELYPLSMDSIRRLNYGELAWRERSDLFISLHEAEWNRPVEITERFTLHKIKGDSNRCDLPNEIDLIYFDAFGPDKQPEMWNQEIYDKLYNHTADGGVIVTYCAKGDVRRGMQAAGFNMSRLPGPPGKRHILRGLRKNDLP